MGQRLSPRAVSSGVSSMPTLMLTKGKILFSKPLLGTMEATNTWEPAMQSEDEQWKQTQRALCRLHTWDFYLGQRRRPHRPDSRFSTGCEVTAIILPTMPTAALLAVIAKFLEPENWVNTLSKSFKCSIYGGKIQYLSLLWRSMLK